MQLQRQESRKIGKKKYDKWVITLPPQIVKKLGWNEGEELDIQELNKGVLIFSASIKKNGKTVTYKEPVPRVEKYSPYERFFRIYNNLPLSERKEVIVVINGEGITWQGVRNYIAHNTEIGKTILKKLVDLDII